MKRIQSNIITPRTNSIRTSSIVQSTVPSLTQQTPVTTTSGVEPQQNTIAQLQQAKHTQHRFATAFLVLLFLLPLGMIQRAKAQESKRISGSITDKETGALLGGSNVLNTRYLKYIGGPNIGGIYYLALMFENIFGGQK